MGSFNHTPGVVTPVFAVADLPAAGTDNVGQIVWTSDGIAGSAGLVVSNGTNWVYVSDNSTTAAAS